MTRDEVLRLACEAGFEWQGGFVRVAECVTQPELERFAALVAGRERAACADLCKYVYTEVADDRDGLAKLCERYIRARSAT